MAEMKALFMKMQDMCNVCNSESGCQGCRINIRHNDNWVTIDPTENKIISVRKAAHTKKEYERV